MKPGSIYVRAQKDGKWGSFALSELDEEIQAIFVKQWLKEGREEPPRG